jgi:hypothetical protein
MSHHDGQVPEPEEGDEREVFEDLKRVIGDADPVPPEVIDAALASRSWRRVDAELADLIYDSIVDGAFVRSDRGARQLTFEAAGLTVEVEVGIRSMDGQLVPPQSAQVEVRHRDGTLTVAADRLGHFRVEHVPHGPVSLRCQPDAARGATETTWVVI